MTPTPWGLLCSLFSVLCVLTSCSDSDVRTASSILNNGIRNIVPPGSPDALRVYLSNSIDENGAQNFQLYITLTNINSANQKWSDQLGDRFLIHIGNQRFSMSLSEDQATYLRTDTPPFDAASFAALFSAVNQQTQVRITLPGESSSSTSLSSDSAVMPLSLSDTLTSFPSLSERLPISRCSEDSSSPVIPGFYWANEAAGNVSIQISNGWSGYVNELPDTGYWLPTPNFFHVFFNAQSRATADQPDGDGNYGSLEATKSVRLSRSILNQQLQVVTTLSRILPVETFAVQNAQWKLLYVGGCP